MHDETESRNFDGRDELCLTLQVIFLVQKLSSLTHGVSLSTSFALASRAGRQVSSPGSRGLAVRLALRGSSAQGFPCCSSPHWRRISPAERNLIYASLHLRDHETAMGPGVARRFCRRVSMPKAYRRSYVLKACSTRASGLQNTCLKWRQRHFWSFSLLLE